MSDRKVGNYPLLMLFTISLFSAGIIERMFWYAHSDVWLLGIFGRISMAEASSYLQMSHNLLTDESSHYRMPLYPLLLALIREVFGPEVWKIVLVNHVISAASLFVLYKLVGHCLQKNGHCFRHRFTQLIRCLSLLHTEYTPKQFFLFWHSSVSIGYFLERPETLSDS